jgi:hypothetical protein
MFEKLLKGIVVAEIIGLAGLGIWAYGESRYHAGRINGTLETTNKVLDIFGDLEKKHDSEKEET